jgi:hypothetical protein
VHQEEALMAEDLGVEQDHLEADHPEEDRREEAQMEAFQGEGLGEGQSGELDLGHEATPLGGEVSSVGDWEVGLEEEPDLVEQQGEDSVAQ